MISGVPNVVEEKKTKKSPKAARDSKEYEKNRTRKFSAKWQVGRPWPEHDHDKGMICEWCIENKQTNKIQLQLLGQLNHCFLNVRKRKADEDKVLFREKVDDHYTRELFQAMTSPRQR